MKISMESHKIIISCDFWEPGQDEAYLRDTLGGDDVTICPLRDTFGNQYGLEIKRRKKEPDGREADDH